MNNKNIEIIKNIPIVNIPLPENFVISKISLRHSDNKPNKKNIKEVSEFLNKYYLSYGKLIYQNTQNTLYKVLGNTSQFCIYNEKNLVGFIGRTHLSINIMQNKYNAVEIGFLSVHPDYRNQKIAHKLIYNVTRDEIQTRNPIAIFLANHKLVSKHFSEILCKFNVYMRYFNGDKYRSLGFLKNKVLYENIVDLQDNEFPFLFRQLKSNEIEQYYSDYMKYLKKKYDVYYDYDFQLFQDFFVNKSKIRNYCIYDKDKIVDYISIEVVLNKDPNGNIITTGKLFAYTNTTLEIETILDYFTVICYRLGMDSSMYQNYGEMNKIQNPPLGYIFTSKVHMYLQNCKLKNKIPVDKICISYYY